MKELIKNLLELDLEDDISLIEIVKRYYPNENWAQNYPNYIRPQLSIDRKTKRYAYFANFQMLFGNFISYDGDENKVIEDAKTFFSFHSKEQLEIIYPNVKVKVLK